MHFQSSIAQEGQVGNANRRLEVLVSMVLEEEQSGRRILVCICIYVYRQRWRFADVRELKIYKRMTGLYIKDKEWAS